ncbi:MAG: Imm50 family immunity protein [Gaiellaceae bacterium]
MGAETPDLPFHDSEVLAVRFDRDGPTVELDIELFAQLPEARTVTLRFEGVTEVELGGLNEQNVLFDVKLTEASDGLWDVDLQSSYGLGGQLRCTAIRTL